MENRWPIEIDGLSIENGWIFHGYVSHNQMVDIKKMIWLVVWKL
jgi:hypothetical protein